MDACAHRQRVQKGAGAGVLRLAPAAHRGIVGVLEPAIGVLCRHAEIGVGLRAARGHGRGRQQRGKGGKAAGKCRGCKAQWAHGEFLRSARRMPLVGTMPGGQSSPGSAGPGTARVIPTRGETKEGKRQGSSSFLKKRTKKLLYASRTCRS